MEPAPICARQCHCCKAHFVPAPRSRATQRFCSLPACRQASKARSNQQWRRKNPDYDRGALQVARVRRWRAEHPGYSRGKRRRKAAATLQDLVPHQVADPQPLVADFPTPPSDFLPWAPAPISCPAANSASNPPALQDFVYPQDPLLVGLISSLLGDALQESFDSFARRLVEQGRHVLNQIRDGSGCQPVSQTPYCT